MRDDFTERTKELLAKRTGYRCSNPDCKKPTVGSNTNKEKSTSIGVAAHITAASPGGPRYNSSLTVDQRSDMDNGIWLCQSCSTLIDKDPDKFTVSLLNKWRTEAEDESFNELMKNYPQALKENKPPILEAEITWTGTMRRALGLSYKNRDVYKEAIPISLAIWDYSIKWMYEIKISNNSSVPAFNIEIVEEPNANSFTYIERLSKINNIQPYHEIVISANTATDFRGTGDEVGKFEEPKFPHTVQGLKLLIAYSSEDRKRYFTEIVIEANELKNILLTELPDRYKTKA